MILDDIVKHKAEEIKEDFSGRDTDSFYEEIRTAKLPKARDFAAAIRQSGRLAIIAEVKRASPSKGLIRADFDPLGIAAEYLSAGADALSVLTETRYFLGSKRYLQEIAAKIPLPALRKDFIIDERQICEAKLLGASAVLLIAAILDRKTLERYLSICRTLGLAALTETHDEAEVDKALEAGATVIGVNNRNLKDFSIDLKTTERMRKRIPAQYPVVGESGIVTREHMIYMRESGADAVLIGETLMRAASVADKIKELKG